MNYFNIKNHCVSHKPSKNICKVSVMKKLSYKQVKKSKKKKKHTNHIHVNNKLKNKRKIYSIVCTINIKHCEYNNVKT